MKYHYSSAMFRVLVCVCAHYDGLTSTEQVKLKKTSDLSSLGQNKNFDVSYA